MRSRASASRRRCEPARGDGVDFHATVPHFRHVSDPTLSKRTPLFDEHVRLGGKMIEFGGWEMPVYYSSIMEEHLAVRQAVGMFDISHMGQILVSGPDAALFLNRKLINWE